MDAQQHQSPKQQLVQGKNLCPDKTSAWRAQAALAVGQLQEDVAAGLVSVDAEDRRATIEAAVAAAAAAAAPPAAAAAGIKPSSPPPEKKSLTIKIPPILHGDEVKTFLMTVEDEDELKEYLRCAQVVGLQKVADSGSDRLVRKFAELVDGGVYTHAPCSKEAFARLLGEARHLQHLQHLQQAREDEFGRAMLQHLQEAEPEEEYELREDLRNLYNATNQILEDDVVIVGNSAAWVGSHKTHVKGAKPVKQIAERARELGKLPNQLPAGVKPAFMVERADAHVERKVDRACRDMQVMRFKRSGQAIKPVNSMAAAGRQQLLRF